MRTLHQNRSESGVAIIYALISVIILSLVGVLLFNGVGTAHDSVTLWRAADASQLLADSSFDLLRHRLDNIVFEYVKSENSYDLLEHYNRNKANNNAITISHKLFSFSYDGLPVRQENFSDELEVPGEWSGARYRWIIKEPVKASSRFGHYTVLVSAEAWFVDSKGDEVRASRRYATGELHYNSAFLYNMNRIAHAQSPFESMETNGATGYGSAPTVINVISSNPVANGDLHLPGPYIAALTPEELEKLAEDILHKNDEQYTTFLNAASVIVTENPRALTNQIEGYSSSN